MKDDTALRFRRYMAYALVIFLWAFLLVFATEFFHAVRLAKNHFFVP